MYNYINTYLEYIKSEIVNFATSNNTQCRFLDIIGKDATHVFLYVYFKKELNDVEEKQLFEILPTWDLKKKLQLNLIINGEDKYKNRYTFLHKNLLSEIRNNRLNELID